MVARILHLQQSLEQLLLCLQPLLTTLRERPSSHQNRGLRRLIRERRVHFVRKRTAVAKFWVLRCEDLCIELSTASFELNPS